MEKNPLSGSDIQELLKGKGRTGILRKISVPYNTKREALTAHCWKNLKPVVFLMVNLTTKTKMQLDD